MAEPFSGHVILELLGHRRLGGFVTEVEIAGMKFLRIDIPETAAGRAVTQFYAPQSIYGLTPVDADVAYRVAAMTYPTPVHRWELAALPEARQPDERDDVFSDAFDSEDEERG